MKKLVAFLFFLVFITTETVIGQKITGRPCADPDQFRDISGMREIILKDGIYYDNLRRSYAEAINYGIGKNVVSSSKDGIEYVLENTKMLDANFIVASDYENGVRYGNSIGFTSLLGQPSDKWAAFSFEGTDYVYAKASCMNPQKPKVRGIYKSKKIDDGFGFVQQDLFLPNRETPFIPSVVVKQVDDYQLPPSLVFETTTVRTKTWFGRKWPIIAGVLVASATTTYFLTRGGHSSYVEPRSMPGGIPTLPVVDPLNPVVPPVTPGLPSDPRTMPGGLGGFNFHGGGGGVVLVRF